MYIEGEIWLGSTLTDIVILKPSFITITKLSNKCRAVGGRRFLNETHLPDQALGLPLPMTTYSLTVEWPERGFSEKNIVIIMWLLY